MLDIPDDALLVIISFLSTDDNCSASLVNKKLYQLCTDNMFWKASLENYLSNTLPDVTLNKRQKKILSSFNFRALLIATRYTAFIESCKIEQSKINTRIQSLDYALNPEPFRSSNPTNSYENVSGGAVLGVGALQPSSNYSGPSFFGIIKNRLNVLIKKRQSNKLDKKINIKPNFSEEVTTLLSKRKTIETIVRAAQYAPRIK